MTALELSPPDLATPLESTGGIPLAEMFPRDGNTLVFARVPAYSTNPIGFPEYPVGDLLEKAPDYPTALIKSGVDGIRTIMPPAAPNMADDHDLAAEAQQVINSEAVGEVLPPMLNSADAWVALAALTNRDILIDLVDRHGWSAREDAKNKVEAIVNVAVDESFPRQRGAVHQYNLLRRGAAPSKDLPQLNLADVANLPENPYIEKPLHEIPVEPLVLTREESGVVLDALLWTALHPRGLGHDVAAMEMLSRYHPSPEQRKLYRAMAEVAGVKLDQAASRVPRYYSDES